MIRRATYDDSTRLGEIHIFGWRSAYRGIISDEYLFSKLSVPKRIAAFQKAIDGNEDETYIYDDNGIIKGFMTIGKCRNEDKKNCFELWGIYIDPCFKRNGIGRQLISFCEQEAVKREFKENVLWVFKNNISSRRFYEAMGYIEDGKEQEIESFKAIEMRYKKDLL